MLPPGGHFQSIAYEPERAAQETRQAETSPAKPQQTARPRRHPIPAAAIAEPAPAGSAAARAKELERRLDALMPGTKLNTALADRDNPPWRRPRPGSPAGEHNSLSVPFDEAGQSGFLARGYHARPDVQNPHGNTGATFGLRTRF